MKLLNAIATNSKKKDTTTSEKFEYNRVRVTIEAQCERYLHQEGDVFKFEALPTAIDATLAYLESAQFLDKYEFSQVSETCFLVRLRPLDIL